MTFSSQYQNHHSIRVCHDTISIFLTQIIIKKVTKISSQGLKTLFENDNSKLSFGLIFISNFHVIDNLSTKINQEIIFVDIETWKVYEHYMINQKKILNQLGSFNNDFKYTAIMTESFVERRSNFKGYQMKTMTDEIHPFITINHDFLTQDYFDEQSQTYHQ